MIQGVIKIIVTFRPSSCDSTRTRPWLSRSFLMAKLRSNRWPECRRGNVSDDNEITSFHLIATAEPFSIKVRDRETKSWRTLKDAESRITMATRFSY